ncbi:MAG: DUF362 domain-containing protein [Acidobacteria bacterium]|nr:DUF362 domain-containing protein [Acidobacteriota bacterium]
MSALTGAAWFGHVREEADSSKTPVAIVKTTDRNSGFKRAADMIGGIDYSGNTVYLKCNFNSPDPYPAATHPEALRAAAEFIKAKGSRRIILTERSGMGLSREILEQLKMIDLVHQLGMDFLPLEELAAGEWQRVELPGSHWADGVEVPGFLVQKPCLVQVCNLKTHRFGGQISASLKNSIGLIAKYSATKTHNYMNELHASKFQCAMIAEVNQIYSPDLILMDAIEVFIKGGPESGELAGPEIIAASKDRVAIDSVGLAILRHYGAGSPLSRGAIFEQAQLKRAVELGLGVKSGKEIQLLANDKESRSIAAQLENALTENSD